jgi:hypothetical protein
MLSIAAEDVPVTRDEQTVPALSSDESRSDTIRWAEASAKIQRLATALMGSSHDA